VVRIGGSILLVVTLLISNLLSSSLMASGELVVVVVVVLTWPVLAVTGTELASELNPISQEAAHDPAGAVKAVGTVAGSNLAGWLVHLTGHTVIPIIVIPWLALSIAASRGEQYDPDGGRSKADTPCPSTDGAL
jgi:predicted MFS family arabinose efflux permease